MKMFLMFPNRATHLRSNLSKQDFSICSESVSSLNGYACVNVLDYYVFMMFLQIQSLFYVALILFLQVN